MTVVTGALQDVGMNPHNRPVVFVSPVLRAGIVTRLEHSVRPDSSGAISTDIAPGDCIVTIGADSYQIDIPESGPVDLWDLIMASGGVALPPMNAAALIE